MAIQLLAVILTTRYLGTDGRGILIAGISWVTTAAALAHLSAAQVSLRLAVGRDPKEWLSQTIGTMVALYVVVTAVIYLFVLLTLFALHIDVFRNIPPQIVIILFLALPAHLWIEAGNAQMMALNKIGFMNGAQLIGAGVNIVLLSLLGISGNLGVAETAGTYTLAQWTTALLLFARAKRESPVIEFSPRVLIETLKGSAQFHVNAIGSVLFTYATVLVVNQYSTSSDTAIYQLGAQVINLMAIVPAALNAVAFSVLVQKGPDAGWDEHKRLLIKGFTLVTFGGILVYFLADLVVLILGGREFAASAGIVRILLFSVPGAFASAALASQWITRGLLWQAALITLGVGILNIILLISLLPSYGIHGAAWATVLTNCAALGTNGAFVIWIESHHRKLNNA